MKNINLASKSLIMIMFVLKHREQTLMCKKVFMYIAAFLFVSHSCVFSLTEMNRARPTCQMIIFDFLITREAQICNDLWEWPSPPPLPFPSLIYISPLSLSLSLALEWDLGEIIRCIAPPSAISNQSEPGLIPFHQSGPDPLGFPPMSGRLASAPPPITARPLIPYGARVAPAQAVHPSSVYLRWRQCWLSQFG